MSIKNRKCAALNYHSLNKCIKSIVPLFDLICFYLMSNENTDENHAWLAWLSHAWLAWFGHAWLAWFGYVIQKTCGFHWISKLIRHRDYQLIISYIKVGTNVLF